MDDSYRKGWFLGPLEVYFVNDEIESLKDMSGSKMKCKFIIEILGANNLQSYCSGQFMGLQ